MDKWERFATIVLISCVIAWFALVFGLYLYTSRNAIGDDTVHSFYEDIKADLIHVEGRSSHVYLDPVSKKLHAGIGHLLTDTELKTLKQFDSVSDKQIDEWFDYDFHRVLKGIAKHFPDFKTYPHLAKLAIFNWMYQLGVNAPDKFPRATKFIKKREWKKAADEWLYVDTRTYRHSKWFNETPQRCQQEVSRLIRASKH